MSYGLHRLKLAEIARYISDAIPQNPSDATCEVVLSLDSKLESLIQTLPSFFRVEIADSDETRRIDQAHTYIPIQRLVLNLMINLIRCKLHFPYLSGHPSSPLHVFSRISSLKAARHVLSRHRDMRILDISHVPDFMKIQGTVVHMFVAALILATDICCNQPQEGDRESELSELMLALDELEAIKQYSQIAAKFLDDLTHLLVKYGVLSPPATTSNTNMDGFGDSQMGVHEFDTHFHFDELWGTFVEGALPVDMVDIL